MWSQVEKCTVSPRPRACHGSFLTVHNSVGNTDLARTLRGRLTSSRPLNTFEHMFLCTAGSRAVCSLTTHCCLLTKHAGPRSLHRHRQDRIPFKHSTQENLSAKAGGRGGRITAELQIPHQSDLRQQIKMFFSILCLYLYIVPTGAFPQFKGDHLIK